MLVWTYFSTGIVTKASLFLPLSVGHGLLPRPARHRVHVRGAGYPEHQRADQATDRLAARQVHQGNKRWDVQPAHTHTVTVVCRRSLYSSHVWVKLHF